MIKWRIIKPIKTQMRRKVERSSNMTTMIETKLPHDQLFIRIFFINFKDPIELFFYASFNYLPSIPSMF